MVKRSECTCGCHTNPGMIHIVAGCEPDAAFAVSQDAPASAVPVAWASPASLAFTPRNLDAGTERTDLRTVPLFAAPVAQATEGWKLVPVEPTEAMLIAGDFGPVSVHGMWRAMLAAAPTPKAEPAHANTLRHSLQNVAASLSSRPVELRGPFQSAAPTPKAEGGQT